MFTGIIEEVGTLRSIRPDGGGRRLVVECSFAGELRVDQSVAVDGVCQTVVGVADGAFEVVAVEETLRKTNMGALSDGMPVNLERALLPSSRLDGHFVQGHVDTTGLIAEVETLETSHLVHVRYAPEHARYLIPVGSIAIDGISLTVARLEDDRFTVAIIPHTWDRTTVGRRWQPGRAVNLEFDLLGKYVARQLERAGA